MKLSEILSISGQPGLYKFVAQSKSGIIVESLSNGNRMPVQGSAKVSSLGDIAVFTNEEDMPLGDVFQVIFDKNEGKESINHKTAGKDELISSFASFIPEYDVDRVHLSDIKKIFSWYNILVGAGITTFKEEETEEQEPESKEE